ncbi:hypothetical protein [Streptomyces sp. NPDC046727]|uniref:hypothetical protein n=1 Tax=Streptomyces sp. NPDC046727 TaxID=3155373 RepID=UPI0033DFACDE
MLRGCCRSRQLGGDLQERDEPGEAGDVDLGAQDGGAVGDVAVGAGIAYEAQKGRRALIERLQGLADEGEFVVGVVRYGSAEHAAPAPHLPQGCFMAAR